MYQDNQSLNLIVEIMCKEVGILQGDGLSAYTIAIMMKDQFLKDSWANGNISKFNYYCGITNDIESNLVRHHIDRYLIGFKCDTVEIAARAEEMLGSMGFDIGEVSRGGNGAAPDSVYVYMYRKSPKTKE